MVRILILASCAAAASLAQDSKKTLDEWYASVPRERRSEMEKEIAEKLKPADEKSYWSVGNDLSDVGKRLPMEEFLPVFLTALKKEKGKRAASLLHAIKVKTMLGTMQKAENLVSLNGATVAVVAPFVEDTEKDARLTAVKILAGLAGGQVTLPDGKQVPNMDGKARASLKKACEKAAKDEVRQIRELAEEALKALEKK